MQSYYNSSGKQVGSDVNKGATEVKQKVIVNDEDIMVEEIQPELITIDNNTEAKADGKENSYAGQNWRNIKEGVPIRHVSYPHAPSRREAERPFIRFTKILKNLHINIPFTKALQHMPTYARFMKELLTKKRKFPE